MAAEATDICICKKKAWLSVQIWSLGGFYCCLPAKSVVPSPFPSQINVKTLFFVLDCCLPIQISLLWRDRLCLLNTVWFGVLKESNSRKHNVFAAVPFVNGFHFYSGERDIILGFVKNNELTLLTLQAIFQWALLHRCVGQQSRRRCSKSQYTRHHVEHELIQFYYSQL